jgi:hypothetical protein
LKNDTAHRSSPKMSIERPGRGVSWSLQVDPCPAL